MSLYRKVRNEIPDPVEWVERTQPFSPDPWQGKVLRDTFPRIGMCTGRQVGKTHVTAWKAAHHSRYVDKAKVVMTARTERQSKFLMRHAKRALRNDGIGFSRNTAFELELENGSEIYALPGSSEETIRGFDAVTLLIIDEAAFCDDELYYAVAPMVAISHGQIVLLSSADATFGFFYEIMTSDAPTWHRYHITAYECPRYDREWLEQQRRDIPDRVFRREYLAEFVDPSGIWIPEDMRKRAERELNDPLDLDENIETRGVEMEDFIV